MMASGRGVTANCSREVSYTPTEKDVDISSMQRPYSGINVFKHIVREWRGRRTCNWLNLRLYFYRQRISLQSYIRAATMNFALGEDLDTPAQLWDADEGGLIASHAASELPLDAIILPTNSPPAPQTLGTNFVRVEAPDSSQALRIDVETLPDTTGSSRSFELRLIALTDNEAPLTYHLDLLPRPGNEGIEAGSVLLDSFGDRYQSLIIAASPTLPSADGSNASWSYSLSLTEGQGGAGFLAAEPGSGNGGGCESCSQVYARPSSGRSYLPLALLGLVLLTAQRRERRIAS